MLISSGKLSRDDANDYRANPFNDRSYDDGPLGTDGSKFRKQKTCNMAMSVIPSGGQFIGNQKKMQKAKNLAQSVGFGLGEDGSLKNLGNLVQDGGILGTLADDAHLP